MLGLELLGSQVLEQDFYWLGLPVAPQLRLNPSTPTFRPPSWVPRLGNFFKSAIRKMILSKHSHSRSHHSSSAPTRLDQLHQSGSSIQRPSSHNSRINNLPCLTTVFPFLQGIEAFISRTTDSSHDSPSSSASHFRFNNRLSLLDDQQAWRTHRYSHATVIEKTKAVL
ncbi:hypothetical protein QR680_007631 [Steinernema hermaphroditum]|uniref:Uncharacterized protein n=1 Tax=Steinernema hermaphroditum TaxID=289476 RepID=A0AA39IDS6_9BILA|nr:hypothetical protein QR680_007631 [Steinernema hermaphroditum]